VRALFVDSRRRALFTFRARGVKGVCRGDGDGDHGCTRKALGFHTHTRACARACTAAGAPCLFLVPSSSPCVLSLRDPCGARARAWLRACVVPRPARALLVAPFVFSSCLRVVLSCVTAAVASVFSAARGCGYGAAARGRGCGCGCGCAAAAAPGCAPARAPAPGHAPGHDHPARRAPARGSAPAAAPHHHRHRPAAPEAHSHRHRHHHRGCRTTPAAAAAAAGTLLRAHLCPYLLRRLRRLRRGVPAQPACRGSWRSPSAPCRRNGQPAGRKRRG
jgi:hypothetical protein